MLRRIKRLFDTDRFVEGSIRLMDMSGSKGEKQPPFDHRNAIRSFNSWVYAAASINAFACAAVPLRLYIKKGAGTKVFNTRPVPLARKRYLLGDGPGSQQPSPRSVRKLMEFGSDFEEVSDQHPILDLLSNVNPVYNGFDLTATRILYGELTGNAYLAVILDESLGVPVQMWTMPSQWTFVQPDEEQFVRGYAYAAPGNQMVEFEREEVIHFRRPNPNDLFYGMGKVEAAWGTVGVNQAIHQMDLSTFANHARPDYAVVVKGPTGESSLKRFEEYVSERLQGTRKSGRFLTMTGDVQLTPLNFPPKDLSGREEVVEEIAAVFGVPVSMLKANDPNLASAQTGFAQWREGTILPLLRMDEDELNQSLIPKFGLEGEAMLCYDNPVPRDEQFELTKTQTAVAGGWMTLNEARVQQGMEPLDEELADKPLVNGQPLGASAPGGMDFGFASLEADPTPEDQPEPEPEPEPEAEAKDMPQSDGPTIAQLNGPQLASVLKVLEGVKAGTISATSAIELVVASGLGRESAARMVNAQAGPDPKELDNAAAKPEEKTEDADPDPTEDGDTKCCNHEGTETKQTELWSEPPTAIVSKDAPIGFPDKSEWLKRAERFEKALDRIMRAALKDIIKELRDRKVVDQAAAKRVLDKHLGKLFAGKIAEASRTYVRGSIIEGVKFGDGQMVRAGFAPGEIETATRRRLEKIVDKQVAKLAVGVTKYTEVRLRAILADGIEKGESIPELTDRVQTWAGEEGDEKQGTKARARTIARTETARATVEGQIESFEESGVVAGKRWVVAPNPCEFCEAVGKQVNAVGLRDNFFDKGSTISGAKGGTLQLNYESVQGAPLHPNCRCAVEPILRSEMT